MGTGAPLNVLLVSSRPLILGALQAFFHGDHGNHGEAQRFAVSGALDSVREAAALKDDPTAQVVVLDTAGGSQAGEFQAGGSQTGAGAVAALLTAHPQWRILALTDGRAEGVLGALRAGAIGAISHCAEPSELVEAAAATAVMPLVLGADVQFLLAARSVGRDPGPPGDWQTPAAATAGGPEERHRTEAEQRAAPIRLTEQESEALRHLLHGLGNQQIAERMFVSASSVKNYLKSTRRKFGARDRAHLVVRAFELGWGHLGRR